MSLGNIFKIDELLWRGRLSDSLKDIRGDELTVTAEGVSAIAGVLMIDPAAHPQVEAFKTSAQLRSEGWKLCPRAIAGATLG